MSKPINTPYLKKLHWRFAATKGEKPTPPLNAFMPPAKTYLIMDGGPVEGPFGAEVAIQKLRHSTAETGIAITSDMLVLSIKGPNAGRLLGVAQQRNSELLGRIAVKALEENNDVPAG